MLLIKSNYKFKYFTEVVGKGSEVKTCRSTNEGRNHSEMI